MNLSNITPLDSDQYAHFSALLKSLNKNQLSWVSGYLTAYNSLREISADLPVTSDKGLTILYGSLTGKGELLAKKASQKALQKNIPTKVLDMAQFSVQDLTQTSDLLLVVSTHGNGAPAYPAKELYHQIFSPHAPNLTKLRFAVLAVGDSSYDFFCKAGIDFDIQLEKLGGKRIAPIHLGDVDVEETAEKWLDELLLVLGDNSTKIKTPSFTFLKKSVGKNTSTSLIQLKVPKHKKGKKVEPIVLEQYSRTNPFYAKVVEKKCLHGSESTRQTFHIELDIRGSNLVYQPGDSAGIIPRNHPDLIAEVLKATGFDGNEIVEYNGKKGVLSDWFKDSFELSQITQDVVKKYLEVSSHELLRQLTTQNEILNNYLQDRDIVDFITDFPVEEMTPSVFLTVLRPLQPRFYSIASSPLEKTNTLELTVGVVSYEKAGRNRRGTCSTFLADTPIENEQIPIFIEPNPQFKLPSDPFTPIILIGAGTGIAPFRSFLQHRSHSKHPGKSWMFFGNRHKESEFLYEEEWEKQLTSGNLTRMDVAFSRDGIEPKYVQHLLRENGLDLYRWIMDGAHVYLCGGKNGFSKDVQSALTDIIAEHGGLSTVMAEAYLSDMQYTGKFQLDVY